MKKNKDYSIHLIVFIILISVLAASCSVTKKDCRGIRHTKQPGGFYMKIIKQTTDERGLTSVVFKEGKDTFAYDYLSKIEYDSIFAPPVIIDGLIKTSYVCPDCGEWGCIYEDIDQRYDQGTDLEIESAIYEVCKERQINDPKTIDLIKANYYL